MSTQSYMINHRAKRRTRAFDRLMDKFNQQDNDKRRVAPTIAERRYLTEMIAYRVQQKRERRREVRERLLAKPMRYIGRRPTLLQRIIISIRIMLGL